MRVGELHAAALDADDDRGRRCRRSARRSRRPSAQRALHGARVEDGGLAVGHEEAIWPSAERNRSAAGARTLDRRMVLAHAWWRTCELRPDDQRTRRLPRVAGRLRVTRRWNVSRVPASRSETERRVTHRWRDASPFSATCGSVSRSSRRRRCSDVPVPAIAVPLLTDCVSYLRAPLQRSDRPCTSERRVEPRVESHEHRGGAGWPLRTRRSLVNMGGTTARQRHRHCDLSGRCAPRWSGSDPRRTAVEARRGPAVTLRSAGAEAPSGPLGHPRRTGDRHNAAVSP